MTDSTAQQPTPQVTLMAHFTRDLSFENVGAMKGVPAEGQPEVNVTVNIDGQSIGENRYQIAMRFSASASAGGNTRFVAELDYGGVFQFVNVPEAHVHPMLFIECPRQLLPFARRVMADVTRDGGYPPLMLDNVDFAGLYRQKVEELRAQEPQSGAAGQPTLS